MVKTYKINVEKYGLHSVKASRVQETQTSYVFFNEQDEVVAAFPIERVISIQVESRD